MEMTQSSPTRQQGRHNQSKDDRKNRHKPNKRSNADEIEDAATIKDVKSLNVYDAAGVLVKVVEIPVKVDVVPKTTVESERPKAPSWFQTQQAFAPSRSYSKKKDDEVS